MNLGAAASSRLTTTARRHDVLLAPGPRFGVDGGFERWLRIPYTLRRDRMDQAIELVALSWSEVGEARPQDQPDPTSAVA